MKLEIKSFRTKVARRIFILFIVCAILPVSAVAVVSFVHVRDQLITQCNEYLRQESKSLAISFYERLTFLRSEMRFIASYYENLSDRLMEEGSFKLPETINERFNALALLRDGKLQNISGAITNFPQISSKEWSHLMSGEALLIRQGSSYIFPDLFMCLSLSRETTEHVVLIGKINRTYILEAADRKPPLTELFVTDRSNITLFSSINDLSPFPDQIFKNISESTLGQFEWQYDKDEYLASYSSIFMKPNFYYPEWIVVLSELKPDVLAPMTNFKLTFLVIIVFTLGLVFFLSMSLIRKNMGPIEVLKDATRKISEGLFGHRVTIESGDEFESLAQDFNEMSVKLKEGQELLVNAAKMSTMGQMAAGIMHEIKQPLSSIYGHLQLVMLEPSDENERKDSLETALNSVSNLNAILERFKPFSSPSKETMEAISLNHSVTQIHELMKHKIGQKNVQCIMDLDEDLPTIYGDRQGLQQVVSNLMINALHALEEKTVDPRKIIINSYSSEDKVYLSIEDNGCGIPEHLQGRIFDPFFTTKTSEKGTGLGMSIIQSILHRHRAIIHVKSEEGTGTKFTITFPIFDKKEV